MKQNKLPILEALKEQDPSERQRKVDELIKSGANVNECTKYLITPLHVAVSKGFEDIVEVLVKSKAELNLRCPLGLTPLHVAIQLNHVNVAQVLLENGANVERQSFVGQNLIRTRVNSKNIRKIKPLQFALHLKNYKMIDLLLENGAKVSNVEASKLKGVTNLHFAIDQDCRRIALFWLRRINTSSLDLKELLKSAKSPQMEFTLLKGFCVKNPLRTAIRYNIINLVRYLIETFSVYKDSYYLQVALAHSEHKSKHEIVKIMLQLGFDPNVKSPNGTTPLHLAALFNQAKIARLLVENGADIDSKLGGGYTPLMGINYRENAEVANILCKSGASLKIRNHNNMSPMEMFLESNKNVFKLIVLFMHN